MFISYLIYLLLTFHLFQQGMQLSICLKCISAKINKIKRIINKNNNDNKLRKKKEKKDKKNNEVKDSFFLLNQLRSFL